jgi:hypothetical protein
VAGGLTGAVRVAMRGRRCTSSFDRLWAAMGDKLFLELVTSDILLQPATGSVILHGFNRR